MSFKVGDTVIKPGLGICKIKAIRKMQVENKDEQFYVLQSGDVKVMVPFAYAHSGGLRALIDENEVQQIFDYFRDPLLLPEDERETPDHYSIKVDEAKEELKQREPKAVAALIKTLFYKTKICDLAKAESEILQGSMSVLADEVAHIEHTTRQKILHRIRTTLTEGRKSRKDSLYQT